MCLVGGANEVERKVCRRCPQGSICGPAVWNMMMDGLLEEIGRRGISCVVYADDLLCMIEADNRKEDVGTEVMEMVVAWGKGVGVEMSRENTVIMLLKGSLSDSRPPNVRVQDQCVKYTKKVKYLDISGYKS